MGDLVALAPPICLLLAGVLIRPLANWRIRRAQERCVVEIAETYTWVEAEEP
jgi:hypothetical protein